MTNTTGIGRVAEERALGWLKAKGWKLLEQNARTRYFELDLVMEDGDTIVFVEVKYRRTEDFGGGVGALSRDKQRRLIAGAQAWLADQRQWDRSVRFDLIAIREASDGLRLRHIVDCLWSDTLW